MLIKEVKTKRLVLRPYRLSDYEKWFDYIVNRNPKNKSWDLQPQPANKCRRSDFKAMLKKQKAWMAKDENYRLGIFHKKTGDLIGMIDFHIYARRSTQFANFGYAINDRYWGHGYGREAAKAALKVGFKQLKLNRLEAAITPGNKKSINLAKRIGMRKEGVRKKFWFWNKRYEDQIIYVANP